MVASLYLMGGLGPVTIPVLWLFRIIRWMQMENHRLSTLHGQSCFSPTAEVTDYIFLPELDEGNLSASRSALMKQMKQAVLIRHTGRGH